MSASLGHLFTAGGHLTQQGKEAADRGEEEYQELLQQFKGKPHYSRGRTAAVKARLAVSAMFVGEERDE